MWTFILLGVAAGAAVALQALINARLQQSAGNPIFAASISFVVGLIGLLIVLSTQTFNVKGLGGAPWWAWVGGTLGAFYIVVSIYLVPRIGAAAMISATVLGQMAFSLVSDHFGMLGTEVRPASLPRVLGAGLIMLGVYLVRTR